MKKLLLIGLCLGLMPVEAATNPTQSKRDLRLLLRSPYQKPVKSPPLQKSKPPSDTLIHDGIKIIGGTVEFRNTVALLLTRLKKEAPLHYGVVKKEVAWFKWGEKGSYAYCRAGKIVLGKRDWSYSRKSGGKGWFLLTIIHEVQHCNIAGDENEDGACWAAYHYGKQMGVSSFLTNYQKGWAIKRNYNAQKWSDNLRRTKASLNK
jgi:hypothetical protein